MSAPTTPKRLPRPPPTGPRSPHAAARDHSVISRSLGPNTVVQRGERAASAQPANSRRQAPQLPDHLRQWSARAPHRRAGVTSLELYRPALSSAFLDAQWSAAYSTSGRAGPLVASAVKAPVSDDDFRRLCTPTTIISRHLQSALRAGFEPKQRALIDRAAVAIAAQARGPERPVQWRQAPVQWRQAPRR